MDKHTKGKFASHLKSWSYWVVGSSLLVGAATNVFGFPPLLLAVPMLAILWGEILSVPHILASYSRATIIVVFTAWTALQVLTFACAYWHWGLLDPKDATVHDFASSLYFSIVTWTTLGYGDFKPIASLRLLAGAEALFGYVHMGIYLAVVQRVIEPPQR